MEKIKTGVDRLLELVDDEGRIKLKSAADKLRQSTETIEAWTDVLESNNMIIVETRLNELILVSNSHTRDQDKKLFKNINDYIRRRLEVHNKSSKEYASRFRPVQDRLKEIYREISNEKLLIKETEDRLTVADANLDKAFEKITWYRQELDRVNETASNIIKDIEARQLDLEMEHIRTMVYDYRYVVSEKQEILEMLKKGISDEDSINRKLWNIRRTNMKLDADRRVMKILLDKLDEALNNVQAGYASEDLDVLKTTILDIRSSNDMHSGSIKAASDKLEIISNKMLSAMNRINRLNQLVKEKGSNVTRINTSDLDKVNETINKFERSRDMLAAEIEGIVEAETSIA